MRRAREEPEVTEFKVTGSEFKPITPKINLDNAIVYDIITMGKHDSPEGQKGHTETTMPDRTRNWDKTPEAQEYRDKYTREHYDRILLTVPKGFREILTDTARSEGLSTSQLVVMLVNKHRGTE